MQHFHEKVPLKSHLFSNIVFMISDALFEAIMSRRHKPCHGFHAFHGYGSDLLLDTILPLFLKPLAEKILTKRPSRNHWNFNSHFPAKCHLLGTLICTYNHYKSHLGPLPGSRCRPVPTISPITSKNLPKRE